MADPEVAVLVGYHLMGVLLNTLLYGFVLSQFLTYFGIQIKSKRKDGIWIRMIVWSLLVLDTVHSGVEVFSAWDVAVNNFGNLLDFFTVGWVLPFTVVVDAFVAFICQGFLIYRVYKFTHSIILAGFLATTAVLGLAFGFTAGIWSGALGTIDKIVPVTKFFIMWFSFQAFSDLAICLSLAFSLIRSRNGFRQTDMMVQRLIYGALETGIFPAVFAIVDLFVYTQLSSSNMYLLFAFPIGRVYTNTLLHVLNSRQAIWNESITVNTSNFPLEFDTKVGSGNSSSSPVSPNAGIRHQVQSQTESIVFARGQRETAFSVVDNDVGV